MGRGFPVRGVRACGSVGPQSRDLLAGRWPGVPKRALSSFEPATWLGTCQVKPSACHEPCVVLAFLARVQDQCSSIESYYAPSPLLLLLHLPPSALRTIEIRCLKPLGLYCIRGSTSSAEVRRKASSSFPIGETLDYLPVPSNTVPFLRACGCASTLQGA